jgi:hypothetical protein
MSKPYGLRDVKITPYLDPAGKILGSQKIDLPVAQTFSFTEVEEFQTLRGDDRVAAEHGNGSSGEWSLGNGGISLEALVAMNGGSITNEANGRRYSKKITDIKPYFKVEGQSINDEGGDVHLEVYRCKATGNIEGEFADGAFYVTSASGSASPVPEDAAENADKLYDIVENNAVTAIPPTSAPRISSVTPSGAAAAASILIQGAGFTGVAGAAGVKVGATNMTSYVVHDDSNIVAVLPAGSAGATTITVTHSTRGASAPFNYTRG